MQLGLLSIDVATITLLALFAGRVLGTQPKRPESWLIALVCLAGSAHVALARQEYAYWIPEPYRWDFGATAPLLDVARNLVPGLFAWLTYLLFTDRREQHWWLFALLALQALLESVPSTLTEPLISTDTLSVVLQITFAALAIYWTLAYWRADLIEARRRTRALVAIIFAVNGVASSVLLRLVIPANSALNYQTHAVLTIVTLGIVLLLFWRLMDGQIAPLAPEVVTKPRPATRDVRREEDELALKRLNALLHDQRIHREPGLSLNKLAQRVGLPEYRMRQLIHEQLGFRNFNAFLHDQRIRDAVQQLDSPELRSTTILTIAQSVGYESVNTFNRGFREVMGTTPSQYREQPQAPRALATDAQP